MCSELANDFAGAPNPNATIPAGLQLTLQDASGNFLCKQPLGFGSNSDNGISTNNKLVHTSNELQMSLDDGMTQEDQMTQDENCGSALQSATAIGFQSLWGNVTFCVDAIQLV